MTSRLLTRVVKLEAKFAPQVLRAPFVIELRMNEPEAEAMARYNTRWPLRPGEQKRHVILAPRRLTLEQWTDQYGDVDDV